MNRDQLVFDLTEDEGFRNKPYQCTAGKLSIGIGRNLDDAGIGRDEANYMLGNDIRRVYAGVRDSLPFFMKLDDVRQNVLLNMAFNMGTQGLLGFKNMLHFIEIGDFEKAERAGLDSKWAAQVGQRAQRLMKELRTGQFERKP